MFPVPFHQNSELVAQARNLNKHKTKKFMRCGVKQNN